MHAHTGNSHRKLRSVDNRTLLAERHPIVLVLNEMVLVLLLGSPEGASTSTADAEYEYEIQSFQAIASKRVLVISVKCGK